MSTFKIEVHKIYGESQLYEDLKSILVDELIKIMVLLFNDKAIHKIINKDIGVKYDLNLIETNKKILKESIFEPHIWVIKGNANKERAWTFFEIETLVNFSDIYINSVTINLMQKFKILFNSKWNKNENTITVSYLTGMYTAGSSSKYYNDLIMEIIHV